MSALFSVSSVAFLAVALGIALRQRAELTLPVVVAAVILAGWMIGHFTSVVSIRPVLWVFGAMSAAYCILARRQFLQQISPGFFVFIFLSVLFYALSRSMLLLSWDEFSHWGQVARFLSMTGRYPSTGDILFDGYPFGTAIWQIVIGGNSEQNWIFAQNVLKFSGVIALFYSVGWGRPHIYVPLAILLVGLLHFFVGLGGSGDILIDAPLAIFTACALSVYFRSGRDLRSILLMTPITAVLPLFKEMGFVLAFFVSGVIVFDQLAERLVHAVRWRWYTAVASFLPFALAYVSHHTRLGILPPTDGFQFSLSWSMIQSGVQQEGFGSRFVQTMATLKDAVLHWTFAFPSYGLVVILIAAVTLLGISVSLQERRYMYAPVAFGTVALAGFALYEALLVALYLFSFSAYEGVRLASFQRYSNTLLLAIVLIGLSFLLQGRISTIRDVVRASVLLILIFFVGRGMPAQLHFILEPSSNPAFQARQSVATLIGEAPREVVAGASTYVLWNGTNGEQFYMSMYALTPSRVNRSCFSIGAPRDEGDVWSCDVDQHWLGHKLESFDYVMIGRTDSEFAESVGELFAVVPVPGWYSVEKDAQNNVKQVIPIASDPSRDQ